MKATNLSLPNQHIQRLAIIKAKSGLGHSEIIHRVNDNYSEHLLSKAVGK